MKKTFRKINKEDGKFQREFNKKQRKLKKLKKKQKKQVDCLRKLCHQLQT